MKEDSGWVKCNSVQMSSFLESGVQSVSEIRRLSDRHITNCLAMFVLAQCISHQSYGSTLAWNYP